MQHDCWGGGSPVAGHYYAESLGTPFKVYLTNGVETKVVLGKTVTSIIDLPGLITTVVQSRVLHPRKLSGPDLKYIRSALCLKSKELAAALGLSPEHYSRLENGERTMSVATEKLYRMYVFLARFPRDKNIRNAISQQKAKELSPEKTAKAFAALRKIFLGLKVDPVCSAEETLEFVFSRVSRRSLTCGDSDAEWENDVDPVAGFFIP
jgi:transcriptional regulator with XRE-family HTH domain